MASTAKHILIATPQGSLDRRISLIESLQHAGITVTTASSLSDARREIARSEHDLLIVDPLLAAGKVTRLPEQRIIPDEPRSPDAAPSIAVAKEFHAKNPNAPILLDGAYARDAAEYFSSTPHVHPLDFATFVSAEAMREIIGEKLNMEISQPVTARGFSPGGATKPGITKPPQPPGRY